MTSLSVIILTYNEESNLPAALDSLNGWAHEIFVVDSCSTDRTVALAVAHGSGRVKVVEHAFENYSKQWNWALDNLPITQPWVLKLDADERVTEAFRHEVQGYLNNEQCPWDAFIVHWRLIFMGRWLRWGGLYPNGNTRLWRRGKARFGSRAVNEHLQVEGRLGEIKSPIDHHDQRSLSRWIERHNVYSSLEASEMEGGQLAVETPPEFFGSPAARRMWFRKVYGNFPARPFFYFIYRYILRLGFLDGLPGFRFAFLHATFLYWIDLKDIESRRTGTPVDVLWPGRGREACAK